MMMNAAKNHDLYMDYASTTPLFLSVREEMAMALAPVGNPSSVHRAGRERRAAIEVARQQIAQTIDVLPAQVTFTSGGTEANGTVMAAFQDRLSFCSAIEHASVGAWVPAKNHLPVDSKGNLRIDAAIQRIQTEKPALVAVMAANNEVGTIQPIQELVAEIRQVQQDFSAADQTWVHVDAVQFFGKSPLDFSKMGCDSLALSAHKIGGPAGVGALVLKDGVMLPSLLRGGGQERRRRPGTPNILGIIGFGAAVQAVQKVDWAAVQQLRDMLAAGVQAIDARIFVHGSGAHRLPHILCLSHPTLTGEEQVMGLDLAGICVSAGPACSSGKAQSSHVLTAMGDPSDKAIRVSLGWETTAENIRTFLDEYQGLTEIEGRQG
ncbi:cysteine desulfurase [Alphaproteobacteria bacterium]|nr:cysteine desulfurase [Alphaproteobacteria bacterium]